MKKLIALAVVASAFASFAEDNVFGCLAINSEAEETIICVPWLQPGAGGDMNVKDVIKTSNLEAGDEFRYYDLAQKKYLVWGLDDDGSGNKRWVWGDKDSTEPTRSIARGGAVLLIRNDIDKREDKKIYVYGQVGTATSKEYTLGAGTSEAACYSLIAPPTVGETDLNTNASWTNVNAQDYIVLPDMSVLVYLDDGKGAKKWGKQIKTRENNTQPFTIKFDTTTAVVPAGQGAWYVSGVGATTTPSVTWSNLPSVK